MVQHLSITLFVICLLADFEIHNLLQDVVIIAIDANGRPLMNNVGVAFTPTDFPSAIEASTRD